MTRASFDVLVSRLAESRLTFSEHELLEPSHWRFGEDARLREEPRFRETPWGRWMLAEDFVANESIFRWLHAERRGRVALDAVLKRADGVFGRRCVFCKDDPRFVLRHDEIHLAASELSRQPVVEDEVGDLEKYRTHLPLHSLKAAAASEPAGEWGKRAQEEMIETLGWVKVAIPGCKLNARMFLAQVEGHSMDDGRSGLVDGGYAVFELSPLGSKQNLNVLVRGAFSDPETGSYAVKKYVADQRDEGGSHNKVSLVSLNPNKESYPNIELQPESDDDITIVAKVIHVLSTDEYERRPKRALLSHAWKLNGDAVRKRQRSLLADWFGPRETVANDATPGEVTEATASLELASTDQGGGLVLTVEPITGLPNALKLLRLVSDSTPIDLLRSNVVAGRTRIPVAPSVTTYVFTAPGFEEELADTLAPLTQQGLASERATLFVDRAGGHGTRLVGREVPFDREVRAVVPPSLNGALTGSVVDLGRGWRQISLHLSHPLDDTTSALLAKLGLEAATSSLSVCWAGAPPNRYIRGRDGASCCSFILGTTPVLRIERTGVPRAVTVLLTSSLTSAELLLARDVGVSYVQIEGLVADDFALDVLGDVVDLGERLFFRVEETVVVPPPARATLSISRGMEPAETFDFTRSGNVHQLNLRAVSLHIQAPSGWPVRVRWEGRTVTHLGTVQPDATGRVDREVFAELASRVVSEPAGDLVFDAAELGRVILRHDALMELNETLETMRAILSERHESLSLVGTNLDLLFQLWLLPMLTSLGYLMESEPHPFGVGVAHTLLRTRRVGASIVASREDLWVALPQGQLVAGQAPSPQQREAWFEYTRKLSGTRALLSDGRHWLLLDQRQRMAQRVLDLSPVWTHGNCQPLELLLAWVQP